MSLIVVRVCVKKVFIGFYFNYVYFHQFLNLIPTEFYFKHKLVQNH